MGIYNCQNSVEFHGISDVGLVRKNNEDHVGCFSDIGLGVVADGVGGYLGGQVASRIAVDFLYKRLFNRLGWVVPGSKSGRDGVGRIGQLLKSSVEYVNSVIYRAARDEYRYRGMSTTIVAFLLFDDTITVVHVGDSRAYLVRDGKIQQLTRDHSLIESLKANGADPSGRTLGKKHKNMLLRAMGSTSSVECTIWEAPAKIGDLLMLSSDGIHGVLKNEELESLISGYNGDLSKLSERLIVEAKRSGSRDNMSVVLGRVAGRSFVKPDIFCRIYGFVH